MVGKLIEVLVNGTSIMIPRDYSIARLLGHLQISGRLAVEVNQDIIPRSRFTVHVLQQGDRVEIVHAIGGGSC